jgi:alpha-beta hydrolase superfamily lysophospholipase
LSADQSNGAIVMKRIGRLLLLMLGIWFLCAFLFALRMTHRRFGALVEPTPSLDWGVIESQRLTTTDGEELGAWFVDHRNVGRPSVVLLHGLGGGRHQLITVAAQFHRRGCAVLLVTQRAHGDSTGSYNDFGFSGGSDVIAAVDWLKQRKPDCEVIVWGTSLGAAAALFGAEDLNDKVAGYIFECPYQNLRVATRNRTKVALPPGVEFLAYHTLNLVASLVLPNLNQIAPEDAAAKLLPGVPVLILAGECDRLALPDEARAIADRIGPAAKVVVVPNGSHTNLFRADRKLVCGEIDCFLARICRRDDVGRR